jgi:hypothetical protein
MKNTNLLLFAAVGLFVAVMALGIASAGGDCIPGCNDCKDCKFTEVKGTVHMQGNLADVVAGANVHVVCHGGDGDVSGDDVSAADGSYIVTFSPLKCSYNDLVDVTATKGSLSGDNDGEITINNQQQGECEVDIGIVNVPLIPEFGLLVGTLTAISAVGIFFVVRRK